MQMKRFWKYVIGLLFLAAPGAYTESFDELDSLQLQGTETPSDSITSSEYGGDICASDEPIVFETTFWGTEKDNWQFYPGNSTFGGSWTVKAGSSIWIEVFGYTPPYTRVENIGILVVGIPINEGYPEMRYLATSGQASTLTYTFTQDDTFDLWVLSDPERDPGLPLTAHVGCGDPKFSTTSTDKILHNQDWTPIIQEFNGVEMVLVPPGCYPLRRPAATVAAHDFCFDTPYWIDRFEVTEAQFVPYLPQLLPLFYPGMPANLSQDEIDFYLGQTEPLLLDYRSATTPNLPINAVNWEQAKGFCEARGARLPTEAEWEYAGRGPDGLLYPWGNQPNDAIWASNAEYKFKTVPVDSFPENVSWVGARNMIGNVEEYTSTIYDPFSFNYPYKADDGREDLTLVRERVVRGGGVSNVSNFDLTDVNQILQNTQFDEIRNIGIRCAMSADETAMSITPAPTNDAPAAATAVVGGTLQPTLEVTGTPATAAPSTPVPTACPGNPPPTLIVGQEGRVTPGNGNKVREEPNTSSTQIGRISGGESFMVVGGPECGEGYTWWQVEYQGFVGWTADDGTWLEPG